MQILCPLAASAQNSLSKPARPENDYRPDIDGLRAIAVVLVLLFHLGWARVSGGFIGVDVFFVISGYLITGIVVRDILAGTFTLQRFYIRRIRRIFPALIAVLIACSIFSYFFFLPSELVGYAHSLLAASLSCANIYFWTQSGYFVQDFNKILLHTWSLSVEEQFYIAWPLLLWWTRGKKTRVTLWAMCISIASLLCAQFLVMWGQTSTAFFMPWTRAWELLLGGAAAVHPTFELRKRWLREAAAWLGLLMICIPAVLLNNSSPFPGVNASLPCLGSLLILLVGRSGSWTSSFLSTRPFVWIGRISYSLYLWHWPVVIALRRGTIPGLTIENPRGKLAVIAISFLAAWLSWRFIEEPFRQSRGKKNAPWQVFVTFGVSVVSMVLISALLQTNKGLETRFPAEVRKLAVYLDPNARLEKAVGPCQLGGGQQGFASFNKALCLVPAEHTRNVLLVGDSHAGALWFGLSHELRNEHVLEATVTYGCPFRVGDYDDTSCGQMRRFIFEQYLPKHPVDTVFLTEEWGQKSKVADFASTFKYFRDKQIPLVVIGPVPEYESPLPLLLAMAMRNGSVAEVNQRLIGDTERFDQELATDAKLYGYSYLSAYKTICGTGGCRLFADAAKTIPMLRDTGHLTNSGSIWLIRQWVQQGQIR